MKKRIRDFFDGKRGSHVGFAISFVIFIGFVIFLIGMISPKINVSSGPSSALRDVSDNIIENSTSNVVVASVSPSPSFKGQYDCVNASGLNISGNLIAKSGNGEIVNASEDRIRWSDSGQEIFGLHYSDSDIGNSPSPSCSNTSSSDVGLVESKEQVIFENIGDLITNYGSQYEVLKNDLGVPEDNDFEFDFILANESKINASFGEIPTSKEVYASSDSFTYLDEKLNRKVGRLEVRLW